MSDRDWDPGRAGRPDRSATAPLLRGLFAMVLVFGVAAVFLLTRGDDDALSPIDVVDATTAPDLAPIVTSSPAVSVPPGTATASPTPIVTDTPSEQTGVGLTVQVLDGVGDERFDDALQVIEALGYEIVATDTGASSGETTVFYTEGNQDNADALVAADGRFTTVRESPGFQTEADLHILVGADWPEASTATPTETPTV